ncbi:MAG: hypothetical protein ACRD3C_25750 [Vicinamibacterales bacterium]
MGLPTNLWVNFSIIGQADAVMSARWWPPAVECGEAGTAALAALARGLRPSPH